MNPLSKYTNIKQSKTFIKPPIIINQPTVNISSFYLFYIIKYELNGEIYYRKISQQFNTPLIEGIELNDKFYATNDLIKIGKEYVNEMYQGHRMNSKDYVYCGIFKLLHDYGYKFHLTFDKTSPQNVSSWRIKSIKTLDSLGNNVVVNANTINNIAKLFYRHTIKLIKMNKAKFD